MGLESNADTFNKSLPKEDKKREENIKVFGILWKPAKRELLVTTGCFIKVGVVSTKRHGSTTMVFLTNLFLQVEDNIGMMKWRMI